MRIIWEILFLNCYVFIVNFLYIYFIIYFIFIVDVFYYYKEKFRIILMILIV